MSPRMARRWLVAAALVAAATGAEALPCDDLPRRVDGRSPRELRAVWRELNVVSTLFDLASGPLQVTRHQLGRDHARGMVVVLSITDEGAVNWQYLAFTHSPAGCRFVGALDAPDQTGTPPSSRLVALPDGQAALALHMRVRSGTGLELHRETWHLVTAPRLVRVLDYPARGHMVGWPSTFDRAFSTQVQARSAGDGVDEVRVAFISSYTSGSYIHWMPVEPLFTATRTAYYAWKGTERRFVLDPARSDLYDDEIEGIFHDAEEQFLQHNVQDLTQLAARATARQRVWLGHFLDSVADGPEKRAVVENLR